MTRTNLQYWNPRWRDLKAVGDPVVWHRRLIDAYSEKRRHYHNLQHLDECLGELYSVRSLATQPAIVEMALWFHDAVYDPRSGTNEEDSASLAVDCFTAAHLPTESVEAVRQLILCTKTHQPNAGADAALLVDIDLAILGQPPARFWAYEQGIKAEYSWVPEETYVQKRTEILASFLRRPTIYRTDPLKQKYELMARTNLESAINRLQTSPS
jgi:predicted metal-dependent HD superfamily phosphohydrolase